MIRFIFIFILSITANLYSNNDYAVIKNDGFNIYYKKNINYYTVEYAVKLFSKSKAEFIEAFKDVKPTNIDIYIYADTVDFISDGIGMWWENFVFKSNKIYINNIDLHMEKNSLNRIIKYSVTYKYLINSYTDIIPEWFLRSVSLYFAKLKFPKSSSKIRDFNDIVDKIDSYTTKDECYKVNNLLYNGMEYLSNNYGFDKVVKCIQEGKEGSDFSQRFLQELGISLDEYKEIILNQQ